MGQVPQPPQPPQPPVPPGLPGQTNGMAITGMVCGILGIVLFWIPYVGVILGILGLVFGFLGRSRAAQLGGVGQGMAVAGIVTGAIAVVAGVAWIIYILTKADEVEDILQDFESEFSLARAHLGL
jgi:Domain of unknown function (DUF4190)